MIIKGILFAQRKIAPKSKTAKVYPTRNPLFQLNTNVYFTWNRFTWNRFMSYSP